MDFFTFYNVDQFMLVRFISLAHDVRLPKQPLDELVEVKRLIHNSKLHNSKLRIWHLEHIAVSNILRIMNPKGTASGPPLAVIDIFDVPQIDHIQFYILHIIFVLKIFDCKRFVYYQGDLQPFDKYNRS